MTRSSPEASVAGTEKVGEVIYSPSRIGTVTGPVACVHTPFTRARADTLRV